MLLAGALASSFLWPISSLVGPCPQSEPYNFIWGPSQLQQQNTYPAIEPATDQLGFQSIYDITHASSAYREVTAAAGYAAFKPSSVDPSSIFLPAVQPSIDQTLLTLNAQPDPEKPIASSSTMVQPPTVDPLYTFYNSDTEDTPSFVETGNMSPIIRASETLPPVKASKTSPDASKAETPEAAVGALLSSCTSANVTKEAQDALDSLKKEASRKKASKSDKAIRKNQIPEPGWVPRKDRSGGEGRFKIYKPWIPCPIESCELAFQPDKVQIMNHFVRYHHSDHPYEAALLSLPDQIHQKYHTISIGCIFPCANGREQCVDKIGKEGYGRHFFLHYPDTLPRFLCVACGTEFTARDPTTAHSLKKCEAILLKQGTAESQESKEASTSSSEPSPITEAVPQTHGGSKRQASAEPSVPNKRPRL